MQNCNVPDSINKIWIKIPHKIKATFFSCFITGLITHFFVLTNHLPNHDYVSELFTKMDKLDQGRWFLAYPCALSSTFSMPWVNGILAIAYISAAACLVVSLLKIDKTIYCALVSVIMITFPVMACSFLFMFSADGVAFCIMLSCLAAFLAERYKFGYLYAIVPLTLSLGGYQAEFGVAAGLFILILITEILRGETHWKKTLFKGVRFLGTLAASIITYFVVVKLTTQSSGLSAYKGIDEMGQISLSEMPRLIVRAYGSIAAYFLLDWRDLHYSFMPVVFAMSFFACTVLLVMLCIKKKIHKEPVKLICLIALLILFPLGCNVVYLMASVWAHLLMIYGTVLVPVFLLTVADQFTIHNSQLRNGAKLINQRANGFRLFKMCYVSSLHWRLF